MSAVCAVADTFQMVTALFGMTGLCLGLCPRINAQEVEQAYHLKNMLRMHMHVRSKSTPTCTAAVKTLTIMHCTRTT